MSLQKVLSHSRALFARNATIGRFAKEQPSKANSKFVATPPTEKISFQEKMVMAAILTISITFVPAWVIYHIPEYQGEKRPFKQNV